jgi:hypothetical protein
MSERVEGNANDSESRHNPEEKNEYKKYPTNLYGRALALLATAALAVGGSYVWDAATGHSRTEQVGDCKVTTRDEGYYELQAIANHFDIMEGAERPVEINGVARVTSHYEGIFRNIPVKTDYVVGTIHGEDPNTHTADSSQFAIPIGLVGFKIEDKDGRGPTISFNGFSEHAYYDDSLKRRMVTETCTTDGVTETNTYDKPTVDSGDFVEWLADSGSRQTVVTLSQADYDRMIKNQVPMPVKPDK